MPDYHDFFNAVSAAADGTPSLVSYDVRWAGGGERRDPRRDVRLRRRVREGPATISFSAADDTAA